MTNTNSKISLLLNIVLLVAVAVLFVLVLGGEKSGVSSVEDANDLTVENAMTEDTDDSETIDMPSDYKIVYVNTDTLWDRYEFVKDGMKDLERTEKQMKTQFEAKYKKLEEDFANYMRMGKAGLLTLEQQQAKETELKQAEMDLGRYEQELSEKLMTKRQKSVTQINDSILSFMNRYRENHDYTFIYQHAYLNVLLSADERYEITEDVIKGLNAEYAEYKANL